MLKWEGDKCSVRTVKERPSSVKDGDGKGGGGVDGLGAGTGEDSREGRVEPSGVFVRSWFVTAPGGGGALSRRWMRWEKKPDRRLGDRPCVKWRS